MPSDPTGDAVRNLVTLRRLSNGLATDVRNRIRALIDDFVAEVARGDPTAVKRAAYQRARVDAVLAKLKEISADRYPAIRKALEASLARVGVQQARWAVRLLDKSVGDVGAVDVALSGVGVDRFRTIMRTEPFHGELMRDWFGRLEARALVLTRQQVRLGMAQQETLGDIVRRIRGRMVGGGPRPTFSGGVLDTTTREAETVARTALTFVANRAHLEAYEANPDVVVGVEFTAVLDSRTTQLCASLDGQVWALDDPAKQTPPLHPNCRSVLVPVVDWKGLGLDRPPEGTRASADGQVPASTTYETWFRGRSKAEQDEIIGPARAALFRSGRITFRDMIGKDNRVLTLAELG